MSKLDDAKLIEVIIETPRGCRNKYAYDPKKEKFRLKKILPMGAVFPYDFGFIPKTKGEDGDPLDILVVMDEPAFTGCLIECRVIGVLKAKQTENNKTIRNDRLIGVAVVAETHKDLKDISELNGKVKEQIEHFFVSYNKEEGRTFTPEGWEDANTAMQLIEKAK